jgi:hypothetical protein
MIFFAMTGSLVGLSSSAGSFGPMIQAEILRLLFLLLPEDATAWTVVTRAGTRLLNA